VLGVTRVTQGHRKLYRSIGHHNFLLTFHSNRRPISQSHRFRDKRQFPSKIARKWPIFPTPLYVTPRWRGYPWNWVSAQGSEETRMMGLPGGRKSFKIGLVVLILYRRVTGSQPHSDTSREKTISANQQLQSRAAPQLVAIINNCFAAQGGRKFSPRPRWPLIIR